MRYTFAPPQPDDSAASPVHFRTAAYRNIAMIPPFKFKKLSQLFPLARKLFHFCRQENLFTMFKNKPVSHNKSSAN